MADTSLSGQEVVLSVEHSDDGSGATTQTASATVKFSEWVDSDITINADNTNPNIGESFIYTITVEPNSAQQNHHTLTATIPNGLEASKPTNGAQINGNQLTWSKDIDSSESISFTAVADTSLSDKEVTFSIKHSVDVPGSEAQTSSTVIQVKKWVESTLSVTTGNNNPDVGEVFNINIVVTPNGSENSIHTITTTIPSGINATNPTNGAQINGNQLTWSGTISGGNQDISFTAVANNSLAGKEVSLVVKHSDDVPGSSELTASTPIKIRDNDQNQPPSGGSGGGHSGLLTLLLIPFMIRRWIKNLLN